MVNEAKEAGAFVRRKIGWLLNSKNESATRAMLAKLRRGIGKPPGSMPDLWPFTLDGLPESLGRKTGGPTKGEWAVHTALTLFALHQQGKDLGKSCMHQEGATLGISTHRLVERPEEEDRIKHRFDAVATSQAPEEFAHHLRGIIQLLRDKGIPLDYSVLTEDLYRFQFPEARDTVRLRWGRDFYRTANQENKSQGNVVEGKD